MHFLQSHAAQSPIYFTCIIWTEGVTNQLWKFTAFYKLGRALGYHYLHTPMSAGHEIGEPVYDFLGINAYFADKTIDDEQAYHVVEFEFYTLVPNRRLNRYEKLHRHIQRTVKHVAQIAQKPILVKFWFAKNPLREYRQVPSRFERWFGRKPRHRRHFLYQIHQQLPMMPDGIDLRQIYLAARQMPPLFDEGKIKLLIHIRQGDTAVLETPWQTYIPLWSRNSLGECNTFEATGNAYIQVASFFQFLEKILLEIEINSLSTIVSSDGFERSFKRLFKRAANMRLTTDQLEQMRQIAPTYNQQQFACFESLPCTLLIGESQEDLYKLLDAAIHADIVVTGTQQAFITRLLSLYADVENPPLIVILCRDQKAANVTKYYGLRLKQLPIITVHIPELDVAPIVSHVASS